MRMEFDIVIIGAGVAGLVLANALADSELSIAVLDSKSLPNSPTNGNYGLRVSAINLASQRVFSALGVWKTIAKQRMGVMQKISVWDAVGKTSLDFDSVESGQQVFGHIIENNNIVYALQQSLSSCKNIHILAPVDISRMDVKDVVNLQLEDGRTVSARLLVGADGAQSWLREHGGFELYQWAYQHQALVTTVETEKSHQQTARQVFLSRGPVALLPMHSAHYCSMVWSTTSQHATVLRNLPKEEFNLSLQTAFANQLGVCGRVDDLLSVPLSMRHVKQYVKAPLVLIGDAAHTIHPLAGQGANLSILDAACLAEVILDAVHEQKDFTTTACLRRYERWRKGENWLMTAGMEGFKRLFTTQADPVVQVRSLGLRLTQCLPMAKRYFMQRAMGLRGDLPAIAKQ